MAEKINSNNLAKDIIGGIIESIEEKPLKNLDWIESAYATNNNIWTLWIKPKATYYPDIILKFNRSTKSRLLKGKLCDIEEKLISVKEQYKPTL